MPRGSSNLGNIITPSMVRDRMRWLDDAILSLAKGMRAEASKDPNVMACFDAYVIPFSRYTDRWIDYKGSLTWTDDLNSVGVWDTISIYEQEFKSFEAAARQCGFQGALPEYREPEGSRESGPLDKLIIISAILGGIYVASQVFGRR